jgi:hypothetical protein
VPLCPAAPLAVYPVMANQALHDPVTPAQEILLAFLPSADEIPRCLARLVGDRDRCEILPPEEAHQLRRITPVRFDAIPWLTRRQGRGDDLAGGAKGCELAAEIIPGRSGLLAGHNRSVPR